MSLGRPFDGDYPTLFKRLQDFLHGQYAGGRRTMLIIDEAQNLEPEALEHLRMISNINADHHQILAAYPGWPTAIAGSVAGTPTAPVCAADFLRFPFAGPGRAGCDQIHRLSPACGRRPTPPRALFSLEACSRIATASGGIPRMINILCDTALVYGFARGEKTISARLVEDVIADKQQYSIFPLKSLIAAR